MAAARREPPAAIAAVLILSAAAAGGSAAFNLKPIAFDRGYAPLFGEENIVRSAGGGTVKILLNRFTGSGFISSDLYYHGFFSASIKLPSDYTAGVVVAFYVSNGMSNGDIFEKNHDELDFEFLGNVRGKEWRIQTNVYGNGSTSRGREERYQLPFDPTVEAHRYSILWTNTTITFYIDDTPIRVVVRNTAMAGDFPSKPMSIYATIWDGSTWATGNGKYKVDYKYAPFAAEFSDLVLDGCRMDPIQHLPEQCREAEAETSAADRTAISQEKRRDMLRFRQRLMTYTCCYDEVRYPAGLPECEAADEADKERYWKSGDIKVQPKPAVRRRRRRRSSRARVRVDDNSKVKADA
ncbi:putative xyloglucan endotransglucosylase/hydrolase protein 30 [Apostasia shenzhenica]|uniref:Xyloglucan endotransglucosylase/hydrolase n=1 Tax=Apostasia shenzhenica TaxID=1088818 RepID=A0A2I0AJL0_9ASPA|nr:putative xyloglucan endotransglucosylase/hydrolase protein 30 [Apostasia shenzhenica]